jgi:hypothetical protein
VRDRVSEGLFRGRLAPRGYFNGAIRSPFFRRDVQYIVADGIFSMALAAGSLLAHLSVPPSHPRQVQHSAEKRIFVMAITSAAQGRR